ncbi:SRPBCC domain-containing protein [Leptolyngbya sp. FACHB-36]|uniref:SRPBCC domain-containing protein n=1 Tax=Leptolyngbya sp. FACHB-36 TaxID=2692808 RepID=UPI001680F381|nr:SRPBCC domain-containing protein [Leptolyngbya sp. FACHB-36]MBD2021294.1 SRPBCC domain-containing protein [Leptolyngbya sp. FACHB-36]
MPSLYTEIEINAPRREVWQALIEKERWKYWNTFLYDCEPARPMRQGQSLLLALRRERGEAETEFEAIVTRLQPGTCLRWVTSIPGFVTEHEFELADQGRDRTQYFHQARFTGALTRVILPFIRRDEHQGMKRMAWELKHYIERC